MDKFNHPLILSYLKNFVGSEASSEALKRTVLNQIVSSLSDNRAIMDLHWDSLERAWFGKYVHVCVKVHQWGWEHNEDTRKLRRMFEIVVQPFVDKNLEDYL